MKLYLSFSQIPELTGLTRTQKKAVYRCAMEALYTEQPSMLSTASRLVFGGILAGALMGWIIGSVTASSKLLIIITACALMGLLAGSAFGNHILHARLRPYLQRVLDERREEIAQIK